VKEIEWFARMGFEHPRARVVLKVRKKDRKGGIDLYNIIRRGFWCLFSTHLL